MPVYTNINVNLTNDLSGTLFEPYVISVEHVNQGILKVQNGGIGTESIPYGSLIIGREGITPLFLTGSNNDILIWSDSSGSWTTKNLQNIESLDIILDNNNIFYIQDLSSDGDKKYEIKLITQSSGLFLASPSSSDGVFSARRIEATDLPSILENIDLYNCNLSGTFTGSAFITNLVGDGSNLYNLTSSQILNFEDDVEKILVSSSHIYENLTVKTASFGNVIIDNLLYATGSFNGDGSGLENLDVSSINGIYDFITSSFFAGAGINISGNIISATSSLLEFLPLDSNINISKSADIVYFSLKQDVNFQNITASNANFQNINIDNFSVDFISSSNIISGFISGSIYGILSGTYSGSGRFITDIPNDSLKNDFIIINGEQIKLGDSIQVSGISDVSSSNFNITTSLTGSKVIIDLDENPIFNIVSSSYIKTDILSGNLLYGDATNLINIPFNNVGSASINNLNCNNIESLSIVTSDILSTNISSSNYEGDGFNLINLNAENIINLDSVLNTAFTGSKNISSETIFSLTSSTTIYLKDDIELNSVTSSFKGDGSELTNIHSPLIKKFTGVGFSIGDIVYYDVNGLAKASNVSNTSSLPIGIVSEISGTNIFVQLNGCSYVNNLISNQIFGTILYLGTNGDAILYDNLITNNYATQIGVLTETNKVLINFKKMWKIK